MYMSTSLGRVSIATLAQDSSTNTTWYIPMLNYVGTAYISQIDAGGGLVGSGVLTAFSANSFTITGTQNFGGGMVVQYNPLGGKWGLQFTGVNLANYTLIFMFVGIKEGDIAFQSNDPIPLGGYVVTSGTAPTATLITVNGIDYTTFEFYSDGAISFQSSATMQGNDSLSGYTSYLVSPTTTVIGTTGGSGATCVFLTTSVSTITVADVKFVPYSSSQLVGTGIACTIAQQNPSQFPWNGIYYGGSGSAQVGATNCGGGGGSAGPGGAGGAAPSSSSGLGGLANTLINSKGQNGSQGTSAIGGAGGGGNPNMPSGAGGLVVITVAGKWSRFA